ncbi:unnamed protein product [Darwinula stevensoni]|uniref:Uncharacterized protein n=1 Tax=Darwinula stevensoni TaxID=69355 RepID=A0A7R8XG38_9CRUS|nr:unnamed protein product [Darwinula stevensoni]CAG0892213.1 unnamed protein product [Darwinula stevensoni]
MGDVDRVTQPGGLHREIVHTRSPASYSDDDADGLQNVQQHSRLVEASSHRRDAAGDGPEGSEEENGQRGGEEELFDVEVNNGTLVMRGRDATRIFCGAVLLPTISALVGNLVFDDIKSNIRRTFYGGLLYIAVKGALKIYYKHQLCMRNQQRQILDYREQDHSSAS